MQPALAADWRRLFWPAGMLAASYAPIDFLAKGRFDGTILALRLVWGLCLVGLGALLQRYRSPRWIQVGGAFAAISAPMFQAALCWAVGPIGNANYPWLAVLP